MLVRTLMFPMSCIHGRGCRVNSAKQEEQQFSSRKSKCASENAAAQQGPWLSSICETDLANDVAEISHLLFLTAHFFGNGQSSFFSIIGSCWN